MQVFFYFLLLSATAYAQDVTLEIGGVATTVSTEQAAKIVYKMAPATLGSVLASVPATQTAALQAEVRKLMVHDLDEYMAAAVNRVRADIQSLTPAELQGFIERLRPIYVDAMGLIEGRRKADGEGREKARLDAKAAERARLEALSDLQPSEEATTKP